MTDTTEKQIAWIKKKKLENAELAKKLDMRETDLLFLRILDQLNTINYRAYSAQKGSSKFSGAQQNYSRDDIPF